MMGIAICYIVRYRLKDHAEWNDSFYRYETLKEARELAREMVTRDVRGDSRPIVEAKVLFGSDGICNHLFSDKDCLEHYVRGQKIQKHPSEESEKPKEYTVAQLCKWLETEGDLNPKVSERMAYVVSKKLKALDAELKKARNRIIQRDDKIEELKRELEKAKKK